jgi:hypothetical protein
LFVSLVRIPDAFRFHPPDFDTALALFMALLWGLEAHVILSVCASEDVATDAAKLSEC